MGSNQCITRRVYNLLMSNPSLSVKTVFVKLLCSVSSLCAVISESQGGCLMSNPSLSGKTVFVKLCYYFHFSCVKWRGWP